MKSRFGKTVAGLLACGIVAFIPALYTINSCCRLRQIRDTGNQCRSQRRNTTNGQDAVGE